MHRAFTTSVFGFIAFACFAASPAWAQHDHAAHAHITAPVPPPATRWLADATLRENMVRIHAELVALEGYAHGKLDTPQALARVAAIETASAEIFAKCKLGAEPDAVLHGMLLPLLGATQKFKADPTRLAEITVMQQAVADYPRYFDAPTWQPAAKHPH